MPLFQDIQLLLLKEELNYGEDSAPGAVNALLAQNVRIQPMRAEEVVRQHAVPYQGARPALLVGKHASISFEVEAKGSGAKGTAPAFGVALKSCKMAEVLVAATSVTYSPVSTGHKSCTIWFYQDKVLFKLSGCRGSWKYQLNADGIVVIAFEFTGLFTQPSDATAPAPTWGTQLSEIPQAATTENTPTFSINAYSAVLRSFSFDAGNAVKLRSLVRSRSVMITGSEETAEFQIEMTTVATFNPFALAEGLTPNALSLVHGVGAGKVCTLSVPKFQILAPDGLTAQDGIVEYAIKGRCLPDAGDDQFTLAFT